jgi:hypothetical protein
MFLTNFIITKCECNSLVVVQWTIKFGESWSEFNGTNEFTPNSMKALLCKDTFYYNVDKSSDPPNDFISNQSFTLIMMMFT